MHQVTPEGSLGPIPPNSNYPSEPAESLQPSVSTSAPNPGEAVPFVEKHGKAETGGRRSRFSVVTIFSDIVAVVVPLAFLTFMVVVWNLDAKQIEGGLFEKWQSAITVLATLFSILFATIVGRLMSEAARWKLERGSRIGLLEQLMGSRTFGSTVQTLWTLRGVNMVGAALMLTWAFSHLGAQALLRMLPPRLQTIETDTNVVSFDSQAHSYLVNIWIGGRTGERQVSYFLGYVSAMYTSLIGASESVRSDPLDRWGNVRIPVLPDEENKNWQNTPSDVGMGDWSSLAGIIIKHEMIGNKTFSVETTHIRLDCPDVVKIPFTTRTSETTHASMNNTFLRSTTFDLRSFRDWENGTWHGYAAREVDADVRDDRIWGLALYRFVDPFWFNKSDDDFRLDRYLGSPTMFQNETGVNAGPTNLLPDIKIDRDTNVPPDVLQATCRVTQRYVKSRISCVRPPTASSRHACRVTRQRPPTGQTAPEQISHLSWPKTLMYISSELPRATGNGDVSTIYLTDPSLRNLSDSGKMSTGVPNIRLPRLEDFDERARGVRPSQLINTYLLLSPVSVDIAGGDDLDSHSEPTTTNRAEATEIVEQFFVSKTWVWLGIVSSISLLIGGVLRLVFAHLARGPEILGYVSTVVRNSKFVEMPPNSSWLDGADLSRVIKDERVRHGFTGMASGEEGRPIGVGYQESTEPIGGPAAHEK